MFIGFVAGHKFAYSYQANIFSGTDKLTKEDMKLFWQAYDKLDQQYLGEIDKQQFIYGAITGAFYSLKDPYTTFLSPEVSTNFTQELSGELEGIGIKIGTYNNYPTVIAPLKDSPAQKAGLKAKDIIIKVDDFETLDQPIDAVVGKIRGPAGTAVKLEIIRDDQTKSFTVKREKLNVDTVETRLIDKVGYILINEFGTQTSDEFKVAAEAMERESIDKIIIDLRNNPGGILEETIEVASFLFNPDTAVVIEKGKKTAKTHLTSGAGNLKNAKLVVLVNAGSASAAEILAGAVKDQQRGQVIGEKTFGKGTVQQLDFLPQGTSVKITVAKWLTPHGIDIDANGIVPDIEVSENENQLFSENDPVLSEALKLLAID